MATYFGYTQQTWPNHLAPLAQAIDKCVDDTPQLSQGVIGSWRDGRKLKGSLDTLANNQDFGHLVDTHNFPGQMSDEDYASKAGLKIMQILGEAGRVRLPHDEGCLCTVQ